VTLPELWRRWRRAPPPPPRAAAIETGEWLLETVASCADDQQSLIGLAQRIALWSTEIGEAVPQLEGEVESGRIPLPITREVLDEVVRADLQRLRALGR
jgi:hypothetical protein